MTVTYCAPELGDYSGMPIPGIDTEFSIPWLIKTDDLADNPAKIYATGLLPARFAGHPDNIFATVRRISARREIKAPLIWHFTVHYSSAPLTQEEEQRARHSNPTDRESDIDWTASAYQRPVFVSIDGDTIMNTAGDLPDPVPDKTCYYWTAMVEKNVQTIPVWAIDYAGTVNSDIFAIDGLSVAVKCARLVDFRLSRKQREGTYTYRKLTMGFEFRSPRSARYVGETVPPPFDLELPDAGLNEKGTGGVKTRIMTDDPTPRPVAVPVLLDGSGKKLTNPTVDRATFLSWQIEELRPFIGLPVG